MARVLGSGGLFVVVLAALSSSGARAAYAPKVAVVLCKESYDAASFRSDVQSSSQALVGLAGLVGAPYETVMLDELLARPTGTFTSVWFARCAVLPKATMAPLATFLAAHLAGGGSVLLDGPLGAYDPPPAPQEDAPFRGSADTSGLLQVQARGWRSVKGWTVRTAAGPHPLSALPGWGAGTTLTQGLGDGTEVVEIVPPAPTGAATLLELGDGTATAPYAVLTRPGTGRVLALSGYAGYAGAATPFRNAAPSGFHDNLLLPRLVEAARWLLAPEGPWVGLLLSHAPLTAVVRLDADHSDGPKSSAATLEYLVALGRDTGVTTAYAIVSSFAQRVQWAELAPVAELERMGGAIGSHSHTHPDRMSETLKEAEWDTEVRASMAIIRDHFTTPAFRPPVGVFINPGNEIVWGDYRRFFKDVTVFFTHGFETTVPYSSGISGFGLPAGTAPVALFADSPAPDYQWLYDPEWSYTVAEAAAHQKQILGWFQTRLGRGALFNQMWHDYALAGAPPKHHPTQAPRPLFDVVREHFARERIYAPGIYEAATKLHLAQRAAWSATVAGGVVTTTLDLARLAPAERAHLAGMGLRLDGAEKPIVGVTVDGAEHPAFTPDTVILPATAKGSLVVAARTGDASAAVTPRLTYLSKAQAALAAATGSLRVDLAAPGLHTRFCLVLPGGHVVLGADRYAPAAGGETCGAILHGSPVTGFEARALDAPKDLSIVAAGRRITAARTTPTSVVLDLAAGAGSETLTFRSSAPPLAIRVGTTAATAATDGSGGQTVTIGVAAATSVTFDLVAPPPPPTDAAEPVDTAAPVDAAPMDAAAPMDLAAPLDAAAPMDAGAPVGGDAAADGVAADADADGAPAPDARDAHTLDAGTDAARASKADGGCGCTVGAAPSRSPAAGMLAVLAALALVTRRRRTR